MGIGFVQGKEKGGGVVFLFRGTWLQSRPPPSPPLSFHFPVMSFNSFGGAGFLLVCSQAAELRRKLAEAEQQCSHLQGELAQSRMSTTASNGRGWPDAAVCGLRGARETQVGWSRARKKKIFLYFNLKN